MLLYTMKIREVTADEVVERARQQPPSREEFLRNARNCFGKELQRAAEKFSESYQPGETIEVNKASAYLRQAYKEMVGANGLPVIMSRLHFR